MNPVLLKPQSEIGAQIVVQGRVYGSAKAAAYQHMKPDLLPFVLESYERLRREADHRAGRRRRQRRRSQSARTTTSPIWALRAPPMCRSC